MDILLDIFICWMIFESYPEKVLKGTFTFTLLFLLFLYVIPGSLNYKIRQLYHARTIAGHLGHEDTIIITTDHLLSQLAEIFVP